MESALPPTNVVNPFSDPSPSEVPPTNVIGSAAERVGSNLPPTNVVHPSGGTMGPADLPPTNVVNPPLDPSLGSNLPPTNVVHPAEGGNADSALPPTNVVASPGGATPPPFAVSSGPGGPGPFPLDPTETEPTFVVSPGADRDSDRETLVPPPETPPPLPPTIPPQHPEHYAFDLREPPAPPAPPPINADSLPPALNPLQSGSDPLQSLGSDPTPPAFPSPTWDEDSEGVPSVPPPPDPPEAIGSAGSASTTMQPSPPPVLSGNVGATVIQRPLARFIHQRTQTSVELPSHLTRLLIGKQTDSIHPDVDVSGFADSEVVSRKHSNLYVTPEGYYIEDAGSANGTYVNDELVQPGHRVRIKPGDLVCLGREHKVCFLFQIG